MSDTVCAVVLHGPKDLRVESRQRWAPASGECQVEIQATGLCGSDLHYYIHGRNGDFALQEPLVLGHEAAGIITAIGPNVSPTLNLKVGDRVAIECGKACGQRRPLRPLPRSSLLSTNPTALAPSSASSDTDDEATAVSVSSDEQDEHEHDHHHSDKSVSYADADVDDEVDDDGCEYCESGRYNLCEGMRFCSSAKTFPHLDGTLQTTMNHPAHLLHPLPDTCSYEQAALAEPLSVVLHAARRVGLVASPADALLTKTGLSSTYASNGSDTNLSNTLASPSAGNSGIRQLRVLVIGAGAVGFLAAALARTLSSLSESSAPIATISAMDIDTAKLAALKKAGYADATFAVPLGPRPATKEEGLFRSREIASQALVDLAKMSGDRNTRKGYDIVFECTGVESCIQMGIYMARTGGKVALVGMGTPNPTIPLGAAALREVDLIGVFRYASTWPDALRLLASKTMENVERVMVTQKYPLEQTAEAFKIIAKGKGEAGEMVLKIMVGPNY